MSGQSQLLLTNIETRDNWDWARTQKMGKRLKELRDHLMEKVAHMGAGGDFLCGISAAVLTERYGVEAIKTAMEKVIDLKPDLVALQTHADKISNAHSIMSDR